MNWKVETDIEKVKCFENVTFAQKIIGPNGIIENEWVPLDNCCMEINTVNTLVKIAVDEIEMIERTDDDGFKFKTNQKQMVIGIPQYGCSKIVLAGFIGKTPVCIFLEDIVKAEKIL